MEDSFGSSMIAWAGKFHPLLVHLPVGILLLGALMLVLTKNKRFEHLAPAIPLVFLLGGLGALFSCATGLMLAESGGYDPETVNGHKWAGIITAAFSFVGLGGISAGKGKTWERPLHFGVAASTVVLVTLAGHLGGVLTHGEEFLNWPTAAGDAPLTAVSPLKNPQEAIVYRDLVVPILEKKCYSCHGSKKQKGKLRLDSPEFILAGGKGGEIWIPGDATGSEIIRRIALDPTEKKHMPPKSHKQVTREELAALKWWINEGADFEQKVSDLKPDPEILAWIQSLGKSEGTKSDDWPEAPVAAAPDAALSLLRKAGVVVLPLDQSSNYLEANFVAIPQAGDSVVALLLPLSKQLVSLKLGGTHISDEGLRTVSQLSALRLISLENTPITDQGLLPLQSLKELRLLNLVNTKVTANGLLSLRNLPSLKRLYVYRTSVLPGEWESLIQAFPKVDIDSGGYQVPTFESDTTIWKIKR